MLSQRRYRHIALKVKASSLIFLTTLVITNTYADMSYSKIGALFRLKGVVGDRPELRIEKTPSQGGRCLKKPTQDLVLRFKQEPKDWIESSKILVEKFKSLPGAFCDVVAQPLLSDGFELRFSYLQKSELHYLEIPLGNELIIDHWFGDAAKVQKEKSLAKSNKNLESSSDKYAWKQILGLTGNGVDLNSPELDKYRAQGQENDLGVDGEYMERKALSVPYFDFPIFLFSLNPAEVLFEVKKFPKTGSREQMILSEAMKYINKLVERKDWLRALRSLEITKRSEAGKLVHGGDIYFVALEGYLNLRLGEQMNNKDLVKKGFEVWKLGLRNNVKKGMEDDPYVQFVLEEVLRRKLAAKDYPEIAELVAWSENFIWEPRIAEKLQFYKAESYFALKVFDDALELFNEFVKNHEGSQAQQIYEREYDIGALFRLGDIYIQEKKWKLAEEAYTNAFQKIPGSGKFSFEGMWYPKDISRFPEVLLNRAKAYTFLGQESSALRDYRAFIYVRGNHRYVTLALFKIAELLIRVGAPQEKIIGTLSECVFKKENSIGARLCLARKASLEMEKAQEKDLGRLLGQIEDLYSGNKKTEDVEFFTNDDLKVYGTLLFSYPLLMRERAYQPFTALEANIKLEPNFYLQSWNYEYLVTAMAGRLQELIDDHKYTKVIENYESRKRSTIWKSVRPEILWRVSRAFKEMELWDDGWAVWQNAEKLKNTIDRKVARPFDLTPQKWNYLAFEFEMALAMQTKLNWDVVEKRLKVLDMTQEESQRAWIRYYTTRENFAQTLSYWDKLKKNFSLSWRDVLEWDRALVKLNKNKERLILLEDTVGQWLSLPKEKENPGDELLLSLAQVRTQMNELSKAELIYDLMLKTANAQTKAMLLYKKGKLLQLMGKQELATANFKESSLTDPDSLWAKLSKSEEILK